MERGTGLDGPLCITARRGHARRRSVAFLLATTALLGLNGLPASAQTWTGAVDGDWGTAGNWDNGVVPDAASDVVISDTSTNAPVIGGVFFATASSINIGGSGAPATLSITGNSILFTVVSPSFVGFGSGEEGIVTLDGTSQWTSNDNVFFGVDGIGTLNVTDGSAAIHSASAYLGLGLGTGSQGQGFAVVDGAGSHWNVGSVLVVGGTGQGDLQVTNGGLVSSNEAYIGGVAGSEGTATLSGNSVWNNTDVLFVGYQGDGTLNILAGGTVVSGVAALGTSEGGFGEVQVAGPGSSLTVNNGLLVIGWEGEGWLGISDDGQVTVMDAALLGYEATGKAGVMVESGGILSVGGGLGVGGMGEAAINVESGGTMSSVGAILGWADGGTGSVVVTGAGSGWTNSGLLQVGVAGDGELTIADGAGLNNGGAAILGEEAGGSGAVTVDNASWINNGDVTIGQSGDGSLAISNGGGVFVVGSDLYLAVQQGSTGVILIDGQNSLLEVDQNMAVGAAGHATVQISGGGTLTTAQSGVLSEIGMGGGTGSVSIDGAGSSWTNHGALYMGGGGTSLGQGYGSLSVTDGGQFTNNGIAYLGYEAGSTGEATVSGATWTNAGNLFVGYEGDGVLNIDGGVVTSTNSVVGAVAGSTGTVTASGSGIVWANSGNLTIGDYGAAELTVGENAIVFAQGSVTAAAQPGSSAEIVVDGILAGFGGVTFNSGSHLSGTGIVTAGVAGTTTMNGTISPGNSIGTLTIVGNYVQNAGSTYEVEIDAAGNSDLIAVTGTATLNGGEVVVEPSPDYAVGTSYTILSAAGGLTGEFDPMSSSYSYFLSPELSYDANNAYLTIQQTATFDSAAMTPNQIATAQGADSLPTSNALWSAIALLPDAETAQQAFDGLSGEVYGSVQTAMIADSRFLREAAIRRIRAAFRNPGVSAMPVMAYGEGGPEIAAPDTDRPAMWGYGYGSWGHWDSDGNAARTDRSTGGGLIGADLPITDWRLGVLAGYSRTAIDVADRASSASVESWHLGLYGGTEWGNIALRVGAAHSWHDVSAARTVDFSGFSDSLDASYGAQTGQIFGELAYRLDIGAHRVEPFANMAYVHQSRGGFVEQGGEAALIASSASMDTGFVTMGLRTATDFDLGDVAVTAHATLGWRHAFGDVTSNSTHAFAGGSPFTVAGAPIARDAAVVEAGLDFRLTAQSTLGLSYSGQLAGNANDHGFALTLGFSF